LARNGQIRFVRLNPGTWDFKPTPTSFLLDLFPIPQGQLNANPNLRQNPGY
jgi:starch-binding outer membrane protein, SusD/RagB family